MENGEGEREIFKNSAIQKPPFTSNKKPKPNHGHGKWRGRERYIYIAPGRYILHLGEGERGMDTVTGLNRLACEDSGLVQCFDHGLWCHGASSLGMKREVKMRRR